MLDRSCPGGLVPRIKQDGRMVLQLKQFALLILVAGEPDVAWAGTCWNS